MVCDSFGSSVAISGDYATVGAKGKNSNQGKAYIFKRSGTTWTEQADIVASDGVTGDNFGEAVAISGDYAIVGASYKNVGANADYGKAYIFKRSGASWVEQTGLVHVGGSASDFFGRSVSISDSHVIVGAPFKEVGTNTNEGIVYFFNRE
jgi:FG-GAP repeat